MSRRPVKMSEGLVQPSRRAIRPICGFGKLAIEVCHVKIRNGRKNGREIDEVFVFAFEMDVASQNSPRFDVQILVPFLISNRSQK
jgi:hypothetical protein